MFRVILNRPFTNSNTIARVYTSTTRGPYNIINLKNYDLPASGTILLLPITSGVTTSGSWRGSWRGPQSRPTWGCWWRSSMMATVVAMMVVVAITFACWGRLNFRHDPWIVLEQVRVGGRWNNRVVASSSSSSCWSSNAQTWLIGPVIDHALFMNYYIRSTMYILYHVCIL